MTELNALEVERYVKSRLPGLHLSGGERRGPCPVHRGKRDSFAVNAETGQAYCHSECGQGWDLIGLEAALTNGDLKRAIREVLNIVGRRPETKNGSSRPKEIERTYPYEDAAGHLLFQVIRFKPKDFRQRRPDGGGGWIWNLQGVEPVLFRLPQLKAAEAGCRVLVCEGEPNDHVINCIFPRGFSWDQVNPRYDIQGPWRAISMICPPLADHEEKG